MSCRTHSAPIAAEILEPRIAPAKISFLDLDGDMVSIVTSKGSVAELNGVVVLGPANAIGGQAIIAINLTFNPHFDGTDLIVTAKPGPLGGDGLVNVDSINAIGLDLGKVSIDGGLTMAFSAGKNTPASKVGTIDARSVSGASVWTIDASVGTLRVRGDLVEEEIHINGPNGLGTLNIGGSLIGINISKTGYIAVPNGKIGHVKIGRDIIGGAADDSGEITANGIGSVTVGGSVIGALSGAGNARSGVIQSVAEIGSVRVAGDLVGGVPLISGSIQSAFGITSVSVGGSFVGGAGAGSGGLSAAGDVGSVRIGGSLLGGAGASAGQIHIGSTKSITIKGDVLGGTGASGGYIDVIGDAGRIAVGGSIITGTSPFSGRIDVLGAAGSISIGYNLLGTFAFPAHIEVKGHTAAPGVSPVAIKSLTIGGRVERAVIAAGAYGNLFQNPDAQIAKLQVKGDWISSSVSAGVVPGADGYYGTLDDALPLQMGEPDQFFSKIARIVIGGHVQGTAFAGDHFAFTAEEIGALSVNGVSFKLTPGHTNDMPVPVGVTEDVTIREI